MNKKIVGILVCMLVTTAAVLPAAGIINISNNKLKQEIKGSTDINVPDENTPQPLVTKTGYVSVSAAAFIPTLDEYTYANGGYKVRGKQEFTEFIAPVNLPHDSTVTKLTFYWKDSSSAANANLILHRNNLDETRENMAKASSSGSSGNGDSYDDTIDFADIDNTQYCYYLFYQSYDLPIWIYGGIIEYTYEVEVSFVDMIESEESQIPNVAAT